jgi:hypothetical protein
MAAKFRFLGQQGCLLFPVLTGDDDSILAATTRA